MLGRIEPPQHGRRDRRRPVRPGRAAARRAVAVASARRVASGTTSSGRDGSIGVADQRLGRDDLEPVRRIESPAEPRLRDERVEHPPLPPSWSCWWP